MSPGGRYSRRCGSAVGGRGRFLDDRACARELSRGDADCSKLAKSPFGGSLGYQRTCRPYVPTARSRPAAVGSVFAMQEQERAMGKKAWSRKPLVAAPALVLAALRLLPREAGVYPSAGGMGVGPRHQLATDGVAGEGSIIDQADPTDDGSIIVECVGFLGRARPHL